MQTYAESLKETLGNYHFYRNIDLIDKACSLLEVDNVRPIIMNEHGRVYCFENNLRIFVAENGIASELTKRIKTDKRYNFVVMYLEGQADISNAFTGLKCNVFVSLSTDDSDHIKASNVFNSCIIHTFLVSAITLVNASDFIGGSKIENCCFKDVKVISYDDSKDATCLFLRGSDVGLLTINNIELPQTESRLPLMHSVGISKFYIHNCINLKFIADVNADTDIVHLVLNSLDELSLYPVMNLSVKYLSVLCDSDDMLSEVAYEKLGMPNVVSFRNKIYIRKDTDSTKGIIVPNSLDNVYEIGDKDSGRLQCAVHFVKGNKCITFINPDIKYATIYVPPVEELEVHGPWQLTDLTIESCGIIPKVEYKGELKKSIDNFNCCVHKGSNTVLCKVQPVKNNATTTTGVFSSMFSNVVKKANPLYSNIDDVKDSVVYFTIEDGKLNIL